MTSTNDGKDVKSIHTSGQKGKSHYIELYKSLDANLNSDCDLATLTGYLCDAWRRVHSLCAHSAPSTHPHLLAWIQRHTARTILQTEWQSPTSRDYHSTLDQVLQDFIAEVSDAIQGRSGQCLQWESQLLERAVWYRAVLSNPWEHAVLKALLDVKNQQPTDEEVLEWLREERGITFVTRLRQLALSKGCDDLALTLASAVMDRIRAGTVTVPDMDQLEDIKEKPPSPGGGSTFEKTLRTEAGFSQDILDLLTDIELVLLHKRDRDPQCINLAKATPLKLGHALVERLAGRLDQAPREKKLWKSARHVATIVAQVIIARCMVVSCCVGVARTALYWCARSTARLVGGDRLPKVASALAAPAATARHLHTLATANHAQLADQEDRRGFVCELYIRAITSGMNELEQLKLNSTTPEKEKEARQTEQTLASWFIQLGTLLSSSARVKCECMLTAFSVHPSPPMYERIKQAPPLPPLTVELGEIKQEDGPTDSKSDFGSWANDSRQQTNLVKTSQTVNIKSSQNLANVLSSALFTEGEKLGLSAELCQDVAVLLSRPRVKTLSWDMDREVLLEYCRSYMERTSGGTKCLTTELRYLNLDPRTYQHLPEEQDDEDDIYYGIEKGYEHLLEFEPQPEEIWQDAHIDPERTDSAESDADDETYIQTSSRRKKKTQSSDSDSDPLSSLAKSKQDRKKERPHSKERSKEPKKKGKDKQKPKKEKKEKKQAQKKRGEPISFAGLSNPQKSDLSKFLGFKVVNMSFYDEFRKSLQNKNEMDPLGTPVDPLRVNTPEPDRNAQIKSSRLGTPVTDSDYDSQGKSTTSETLESDSVNNKSFPVEDFIKTLKDMKDQPRHLVKESITKLLNYRKQKANEIQQKQNSLQRDNSLASLVGSKIVNKQPIMIPDLPDVHNVPKSGDKSSLKDASAKSIGDRLSQINTSSKSLPKPAVSKNSPSGLVDKRRTKKPSSENIKNVPSPVTNSQTSSPSQQNVKGVLIQKPSSTVTTPQPVKPSFDPNQNSYHRFLMELQETKRLALERSKNPQPEPTSSKKGMIKVPNSNETTLNAKPSQQKMENVPNTFARRNHMHQTNKRITQHQESLQFSISREIDQRIANLTERKMKELHNLSISSYDSNNLLNLCNTVTSTRADSPRVEIQKVEKPTPASTVIVANNPVMSNLLEGNVVTIARNPAYVNNSPKLDQPKMTGHSALSERDQQDVLRLLMQQNKLNAKVEALNVGNTSILKSPKEKPAKLDTQVGNSQVQTKPHNLIYGSCLKQESVNNPVIPHKTVIQTVNMVQSPKPAVKRKPKVKNCPKKNLTPTSSSVSANTSPVIAKGFVTSPMVLKTYSTPPRSAPSTVYNFAQQQTSSAKKGQITPPMYENAIQTPTSSTSTRHLLGSTQANQQTCTNSSTNSLLINPSKTSNDKCNSTTKTSDFIQTGANNNFQTNKIKTPQSSPGQKDMSSQDWASVMDGLLKLKTPCRPTALDMVLNKDNKEAVKTETLRQLRIVKSNSRSMSLERLSSIPKVEIKPGQSSQDLRIPTAKVNTKKDINSPKMPFTKDTFLEASKAVDDMIKKLEKKAKRQMKKVKVAVQPSDEFVVQKPTVQYPKKDPIPAGFTRSDYDIMLGELLDDDLLQEIDESPVQCSRQNDSRNIKVNNDVVYAKPREKNIDLPAYGTNLQEKQIPVIQNLQSIPKNIINEKNSIQNSKEIKIGFDLPPNQEIARKYPSKEKPRILSNVSISYGSHTVPGTENPVDSNAPLVVKLPEKTSPKLTMHPNEIVLKIPAIAAKFPVQKQESSKVTQNVFLVGCKNTYETVTLYGQSENEQAVSTLPTADNILIPTVNTDAQTITPETVIKSPKKENADHTPVVFNAPNPTVVQKININSTTNVIQSPTNQNVHRSAYPVIGQTVKHSTCNKFPSPMDTPPSETDKVSDDQKINISPTNQNVHRSAYPVIGQTVKHSTCNKFASHTDTPPSETDKVSDATKPASDVETESKGKQYILNQPQDNTKINLDRKILSEVPEKPNIPHETYVRSKNFPFDRDMKKENQQRLIMKRLSIINRQVDHRCFYPPIPLAYAPVMPKTNPQATEIGTEKGIEKSNSVIQLPKQKKQKKSLANTSTKGNTPNDLVPTRVSRRIELGKAKKILAKKKHDEEQAIIDKFLQDSLVSSVSTTSDETKTAERAPIFVNASEIQNTKDSKPALKVQQKDIPENPKNELGKTEPTLMNKAAHESEHELNKLVRDMATTINIITNSTIGHVVSDIAEQIGVEKEVLIQTIPKEPLETEYLQSPHQIIQTPVAKTTQKYQPITKYNKSTSEVTNAVKENQDLKTGSSAILSKNSTVKDESLLKNLHQSEDVKVPKTISTPQVNHIKQSNLLTNFKKNDISMKKAIILEKYNISTQKFKSNNEVVGQIHSSLVIDKINKKCIPHEGTSSSKLDGKVQVPSIVETKTPSIKNNTDVIDLDSDSDVDKQTKKPKITETVQVNDQKPKQSFNINQESEITQSYKDSIQITELPHDGLNPFQRKVRIKMPNNKAFVATITGKHNLNFDALFAIPQLRSVLLSDNAPNKRTVRIQNPDHKNPLVETNEIKPLDTRTTQGPLETVDLLSDDEENNVKLKQPTVEKQQPLYFYTEFGKFRVSESFDKQTLSKYQRQLFQKCEVKLNRCKEPEIIQNNSGLQEHATDCLTPPPTANHEESEQQTEAPSEPYVVPEVIDLDDSSNDSVVAINDIQVPNVPPVKIINKFKNLLLKELFSEDMTNPAKILELPSESLDLDSEASSDMIQNSQTVKIGDAPIQRQDYTRIIDRQCVIKLVRCDDVVNSWKQKLSECDIISDDDLDLDETSLPCSTVLSRSGSFSILNQLEIDTEMHDTEMHSPVIDVFEAISDLYDIEVARRDEQVTSPVMQVYDIIASVDKISKPLNKESFPTVCETDWFFTKPILKRLAITNQLDRSTEKVISHSNVLDDSTDCEDISVSSDTEQMQDIQIMCHTDWSMTKAQSHFHTKNDLATTFKLDNSTSCKDLTDSSKNAIDITEIAVKNSPSLKRIMVNYFADNPIINSMQHIAQLDHTSPQRLKRKSTLNEASKCNKISRRFAPLLRSQSDSKIADRSTKLSGPIVETAYYTMVSEDKQVLCDDTIAVENENKLTSIPAMNIDQKDNNYLMALKNSVRQDYMSNIPKHYNDDPEEYDKSKAVSDLQDISLACQKITEDSDTKVKTCDAVKNSESIVKQDKPSSIKQVDMPYVTETVMEIPEMLNTSMSLFEKEEFSVLQPEEIKESTKSRDGLSVYENATTRDTTVQDEQFASEVAIEDTKSLIEGMRPLQEVCQNIFESTKMQEDFAVCETAIVTTTSLDKQCLSKPLFIDANSRNEENVTLVIENASRQDKLAISGTAVVNTNTIEEKCTSKLKDTKSRDVYLPETIKDTKSLQVVSESENVLGNLEVLDACTRSREEHTLELVVKDAVSKDDVPIHELVAEEMRLFQEGSVNILENTKQNQDSAISDRGLANTTLLDEKYISGSNTTIEISETLVKVSEPLLNDKSQHELSVSYFNSITESTKQRDGHSVVEKPMEITYLQDELYKSRPEGSKSLDALYSPEPILKDLKTLEEAPDALAKSKLQEDTKLQNESFLSKTIAENLDTEFKLCISESVVETSDLLVKPNQLSSSEQISEVSDDKPDLKSAMETVQTPIIVYESDLKASKLPTGSSLSDSESLTETGKLEDFISTTENMAAPDKQPSSEPVLEDIVVQSEVFVKKPIMEDSKSLQDTFELGNVCENDKQQDYYDVCETAVITSHDEKMISKLVTEDIKSRDEMSVSESIMEDMKSLLEKSENVLENLKIPGDSAISERPIMSNTLLQEPSIAVIEVRDKVCVPVPIIEDTQYTQKTLVTENVLHDTAVGNTTSRDQQPLSVESREEDPLSKPSIEESLQKLSENVLGGTKLQHDLIISQKSIVSTSSLNDQCMFEPYIEGTESQDEIFGPDRIMKDLKLLQKVPQSKRISENIELINDSVNETKSKEDPISEPGNDLSVHLPDMIESYTNEAKPYYENIDWVSHEYVIKDVSDIRSNSSFDSTSVDVDENQKIVDANTIFQDSDDENNDEQDFVLAAKEVGKGNSTLLEHTYCSDENPKTIEFNHIELKCRTELIRTDIAQNQKVIAEPVIDNVHEVSECQNSLEEKKKYQDDTGVVLKDSEFEDPFLGFGNPTTKPDTQLEFLEACVLDILDESDEELKLVTPQVTYSMKPRKRKFNNFNMHGTTKRTRRLKSRDTLDSSNVLFSQRRKSIDVRPLSINAVNELSYTSAFESLINYYDHIDLSYSMSYHVEQIDATELLQNWPIKDSIENKYDGEIEVVELFTDDNEKKPYEFEIDKFTFAEEINAAIEQKIELLDEADDTNFNMGFGERSGRVIQDLKQFGAISKLSAAALSDVKHYQPFLLSESSKNNYENDILRVTEDYETKHRFLRGIKLHKKIKLFFENTAKELTGEQKNLESKYNKITQGFSVFPFEKYTTANFEPFPIEVTLQVVQVGQLPVSAAAQNPVTCDPRVTHVSDASPSQCSENSPSDDPEQSNKTEYTELTTADLSMPIIGQEYRNEPETQGSLTPCENITIESSLIESDIRIELEEETPEEPEINSKSEPEVENKNDKICTQDDPDTSSPTQSDSNSQFVPPQQECQEFIVSQQINRNGCTEKPDQIAQAMNVAGITTEEETNSTAYRTRALVDLLTQGISQGQLTTTQNTTMSYPKTTTINAMSLQQALAQILPPPLNQTGENHQQVPTSVGPQVFHIVHNSPSGNLTLVDGSQQSAMNANSTPMIHIVQNNVSNGCPPTNGGPAHQQNSFSGISLVDTGLQQGGGQLLHIVNTGNQKNPNSGQLLKRVNLLTNLTNVQGSNEQKMLQFVCKSADGKSIQLSSPHQRSMVLRLQPIETLDVQNTAQKLPESQEHNSVPSNNSVGSNKDCASQQEIKSRSVYEENYAKFIQNSSAKPGSEKSTSLPKFNQAFGKPVFQDGSEKSSDSSTNDVRLSSGNTVNENNDCQTTENTINLDHITGINNPPLLLRKTPASVSQAPPNLVQQIKQTIAPMNIQTMHGGVIYTRQIPVNIGSGQTINLISVPTTELADESNQKQSEEPSIIKIVPQIPAPNAEVSAEDGSVNLQNDGQNPQPVLTQMRIKLPMLSKNPQMIAGARVVRPSFFQIQRNVIGGANQPVYQQLVLTAAPQLGQQTIRLPQAQTVRQVKVPDNQSPSETQMSSSTLEQLREFDMVLEQVKERSTVQPNQGNKTSNDTTDSPVSTSSKPTETKQVLYSISNRSLAYASRKAAVTTFARSPDSSGIVDSPSSSQNRHSASSDAPTTQNDGNPNPPKKSHKSKSKSKSSSHSSHSSKVSTAVTNKTSTQKPLEDEQTTQRILYILAEYKEQVENSPDKDKPAPRRRTNVPSNPGSRRKKRRSGGRDFSPLGDDSRTIGSEDSSCGTSQGDCAESLVDSVSPQSSPSKVARKLTFDQDANSNPTSTTPIRPQPQRNVIVADGQTITVGRGGSGKPATAVIMPSNYLLPLSMVKGGQQIAIVTNQGPKLLTVTGGETPTANALLLQRLIGPAAAMKPVLARPGIRHVRLPTAALQRIQAFNLATTATTGVINSTTAPPDSTASPIPESTAETDPQTSSPPWADKESESKPDRASSPEDSEPWNLPSSADPNDYSYEETVTTDNLDRTVLEAIPDRYSPDMEAHRIFDKMFDVESKKTYVAGYDIDEDKTYQVVRKKDMSAARQHRLAYISAAALRHKHAILEHELRLQKSLSEECEDLGVDSPSASDLFPEAELLFSGSPAPAPDHGHERDHDPPVQHPPQPTILNETLHTNIEDQIMLPREDRDINLGLEDVGIVTVSEDGMQASITLDQEEFARSHPNTTFHSEPTEEGEVQQFTLPTLKGRHITSTIFHPSRAATVLMSVPQSTVMQVDAGEPVKYTHIDNIVQTPRFTSLPQHTLNSVLVKDDGLTRFDGILNDTRELHLSNTASAIVHSNTTQVIRKVCYEDVKRERERFMIDEPESVIAGKDAKMVAEDSRDSMPGLGSSPEQNTELFWESNSASERSESRRPLDFSSDSDKCCKSPLYDETNSTDSSGVSSHIRLSVVKEARSVERSRSADGSSADDTHPPLRTYPPKRTYHNDNTGKSAHESQRTDRSSRSYNDAMDRSLSGKTRAGFQGEPRHSPDISEVRRRASNRGVVKKGCHCCNGSPAPPRPKKSRHKKHTDFSNNH